MTQKNTSCEFIYINGGILTDLKLNIFRIEFMMLEVLFIVIRFKIQWVFDIHDIIINTIELFIKIKKYVVTILV